MNLSIEDYDRMEAAERRTACYPAIRAFSPTHFRLNGFPDRVTHEDELARYADIMGETTPRQALLEESRFSRVEAVYIKEIAERVEDLTGIFPLACLFGPITMLRAIDEFANGRVLTVMDVGAGSGYLCAFLQNMGHRTIAVEVSQALYLWQDRLFGGRSGVTQIPWWEYAKLCWHPMPFDLMVCDAALGEMDVWAMRYTMQLAAKAGVPLFYRTAGEQRASTEFGVGEYAKEIGLTLIKVADPSPIGGPANLRIDDFLDIPQERLSESYAFMDFIGVGR